MRPVADLGKVHCTEAMGRTAEALTEYSAFASNHPGDVLEPLARFGQARCLEELGRADEARAIYEECIAAHPDTVWQAEAEQALTALKRRMRKPSVRL
jgi:TolA-binding protein